MIQSKADLAKWQANIVKHQNGLNEEGYLPDTRLVNMIRSAIRQVWMHNPVKLLKLELGTVPDMDTTTRTKWLVKCEHCKQFHKKGNIEVDHINGHHKFIKIEEFADYYENILNVTLDELKLL